MVLRLPSSRIVTNVAAAATGKNVDAGGHGHPQDRQQDRDQHSTSKGRKIAPLPAHHNTLNHTRFKRRTASRQHTTTTTDSCGPTQPTSEKRSRDDEDRDTFHHSSFSRPSKRLRLAPADAKPITLSYRVPNVPSAIDSSPKVIQSLTHRHERELTPVVSKVHATATVVHPLDDYEVQTTCGPCMSPPVATRPAPPPPPSSDAKLIRQRQAQAFKQYLTTSSELKLYRTMQVNNATRSGRAYVAFIPMVRSTLSGPRTARDKWNKLKVRIINRPPKGATTSSSLHIAKRPKPAQPSLARYAIMMNIALREAERAREEILTAGINGDLVERPFDSLDDEGEGRGEESDEQDEFECVIGESFTWTHPDLE